jgi:hypothetical protein
MNDEFLAYRRWFQAAAVYNAAWGIAVVLFPGTLLQIAGLTGSEAVPLARVIGMMVGVYAYGYYLLAREPERYSGLIWIGLAGKPLDPWDSSTAPRRERFRGTFGWVCLFNDLIWWPVFWRFALRHAKEPVRRSV